MGHAMSAIWSWRSLLGGSILTVDIVVVVDIVIVVVDIVGMVVVVGIV